MYKHDWNEKEKAESLEALLHLYQPIFLMIKNFENSEESGEFDQFWKSSNPSEPNEWIKLRAAHEQTEGEYGSEVDDKPPIQILFGYRYTIGVYFKVFIVKGSVENNDHI